jgi:hypothetical protein
MSFDESHDEDIETHIDMRKPCPKCRWTVGLITTRSGQDTVWCERCSGYCYNAPRSETGRAVRSLRTRPGVRPSQRNRVLVRDGFACVMCHRANVELEVGHIVSVRDGRTVAANVRRPHCVSDAARSLREAEGSSC